MPVTSNNYKKNINLASEEIMNKAELVSAIAKETETTKVNSETILEAFIDTVTNSLKSNEDVKLVGFGTFSVSERKARVGRNPQTGEEIKIPACKAPVFRPGSDLKDLLK